MSSFHTLFHFTSREMLETILQEGITKGDVATGPTTGFNAPWLTGDPSWERQCWAHGCLINKTAVRLIVEVPLGDKLLQSWHDLARIYEIDRSWFHALNKTDQADKWYIYKKVIPKDFIKGVDYNPKLPNTEVIKTEEEIIRFEKAKKNSEMFLKRCHRKR